ncbi:MAG: RimK family alpha-L-glutamate ligase [Desulfobacter sp.]|nr:MAG: RimK family alpha-L-glutamate ligase [Desulfobacter sp.]
MNQRQKTGRPLAIGARLKACPGIRTIGFRPNFRDYSPAERKQIMAAEKIYYPTAFYADLFNAMGKPTFPSFHTYKFAQDKIRQTAAFNMLGIPHPRTQIFYGPKQKKQILSYFSFPFVAKIGRGSARGNGVFLIKTQEDLDTYLSRKGPAYIQEYLPIERDMRLVVIGRAVRLAFWRTAAPAEFRTNVSQGAGISFDPLPPAVNDLALSTAAKCGWDDVGLDIAEVNGRYYVLEGNMKYGTKGFQQAGINYKELVADLICRGEL